MDKPTLPRPAPGCTYLFNRRNHAVEYVFDGVRYSLPAREYMAFPDELAMHFWRHSLVSFDPRAGMVIRELALPHEPTFGEPLDTARGVELFDRTVNASYVDKGTGGDKTHAAVITVEQPADSGAKFPELG